MGLDISAYKGVKVIDNPPTNEYGEVEDYDKIFHGHFPTQAGNLVDGSYYECEDSEHFFSRSYGGYGMFRNTLAWVAGYPKYEIEKPSFRDPEYNEKDFAYRFPYSYSAWNQDNGAFKELICFSDCEGYICSEVCKKLYNDFVEHKDKAEEMLDDRDYKGYLSLMNAFEYAMDDGYVRFA